MPDPVRSFSKRLNLKVDDESRLQRHVAHNAEATVDREASLEKHDDDARSSISAWSASVSDITWSTVHSPSVAVQGQEVQPAIVPDVDTSRDASGPTSPHIQPDSALSGIPVPVPDCTLASQDHVEMGVYPRRNALAPYEPTYLGMERAIWDCRSEMRKIVQTVGMSLYCFQTHYYTYWFTVDVCYG